MSSFCTAKATHIFSAKNFSIFAYHSIEILTTSLVLNNWALIVIITNFVVVSSVGIKRVDCILKILMSENFI